MSKIANCLLDVAFLLAVGGLIFLTSCSPKPDNEISEMADRCMRNGKSITIKFEPHPMDKNTLESEEKK